MEQDNHIPEVTTEPQRQALDKMSQDLIVKLNQMVKEQHIRAKAFVEQQHSLSERPMQLPESLHIALPQVPQSTDTPSPAGTSTPSWGMAEASEPQTAYTRQEAAIPPPPPPPPPLQQDSRRSRRRKSQSAPVPPPPDFPWTDNDMPRPEQKKDNSLSTGCFTIIGIIVLLSFLRDCS